MTNHAVVAMVGDDVKQTRCTTCDAEHEYKHAKVPRQRRKTDTPAALYAQVLAGGPKRVAHDRARPRRALTRPTPPDEARDADGSAARHRAAADVRTSSRSRRGSPTADDRGRRRRRTTDDDARRGRRSGASAADPRARCRGTKGSRRRRGRCPNSPSASPAAAGRIDSGRATSAAAGGAAASSSAATAPAAVGTPRGDARRRRRQALRSGTAAARPGRRRRTRRRPASRNRGRRRANADATALSDQHSRHGRSRRQARPHRRRRQQALDLVGDRAGGGRGRRPPRAHLSERAARRERPRARRARSSNPLVLPCDVSSDEQIADAGGDARSRIRRPRFPRARRGVRASATSSTNPFVADVARGLPHRARRQRLFARSRCARGARR